MSDGEQPDESQKTEEPTQKRLQEARRKGQVPVSREINNWVMLLAGTVIIGALSPTIMRQLREILVVYLSDAHAMPSLPGGMFSVLGVLFFKVFAIMALPVIILMIAAVSGPLLQVGPMFAPEAIQPKLDKISPMSGFKRLFSKNSLMEFCKGLLKMGAIVIVAYVLLSPYYDRIEHMVGLPVPLLLNELMTLVMRLLIGVLVVLIVIAVVDVTFQRMQYQQKMRMTRQEVRDELKQSEGDPHVRARLRQLRQEKARQRMMQAVPDADVVITNPTHYSIALKYKPEEMDAPICVAKGIDQVALRIREIAKEHDIILYENKPLARVLYDTVEIDDFIPAEQYKAVAEIISYVFKLKGRLK